MLTVESRSRDGGNSASNFDGYVRDDKDARATCMRLAKARCFCCWQGEAATVRDDGVVAWSKRVGRARGDRRRGGSNRGGRRRGASRKEGSRRGESSGGGAGGAVKKGSKRAAEHDGQADGDEAVAHRRGKRAMDREDPEAKRQKMRDKVE